MRTVALLLGSVCALAATDSSTPAHQKTSQTKKKTATRAHSTASKTGTRSSSKTPAKHSRTAAKRGKTKSSAAASWRSRQLAPTADRYKEIQSSLVSKGYLNQPANGVWNAQSEDALRRFQRDQNLEPTGKLNSLSLIALGLGARRTTVAAAPAPAGAAPRVPSIDAPPALPHDAIPQSPPPNFGGPELPAAPPGDAR